MVLCMFILLRFVEHWRLAHFGKLNEKRNTANLSRFWSYIISKNPCWRWQRFLLPAGAITTRRLHQNTLLLPAKLLYHVEQTMGSGVKLFFSQLFRRRWSEVGQDLALRMYDVGANLVPTRFRDRLC